MRKPILIVAAVCVIWPFVLVAAEDDSESDSSAALPKDYAGKYLLAKNTLSPDKTIGIIYPKTDLCAEEEGKDCKDYLVHLKPFKILGTLDTKSPHYQNKNHGGIS